METPQDKIREFFWELDKQFPANHPFIVLHGPADKFREYLETHIEDQEYFQKIYEENMRLKEVEEETRDLKEAVADVVDALESIDTDKDSREEITTEIETIIKELKAAM